MAVLTPLPLYRTAAYMPRPMSTYDTDCGGAGGVSGREPAGLGVQVREHSSAVECCGPHAAISPVMLRSSNWACSCATSAGGEAWRRRYTRIPPPPDQLAGVCVDS